MTIEKVSQDSMLTQFKEQLSKLIGENQQLAEKIKQNEMQALKLQGAIETLEYYNPPTDETMSHPPEEEVDNADVD
tara:strand:+ start:954 stop:1181 length:228 start_codon:yes stop_codon:yes gene_type:complete